MLNEGKDTVHYELGPGKVLCMQTDPTVTRDRHRVTCKRCLRKLKKGIRQRDLSGGVKSPVRHLLKPKNQESSDEGVTIGEVREIVRNVLSESWDVGPTATN